MRVLLEFTTLNYRIVHGMAKRFKELYPESQFAGILAIAPGQPAAPEFLQSQTEIRYDFLELQHVIIKDSLHDEIDYGLLKEFEERTPEKSLWRLIASDRQWGVSFLHGAVVTKNFINLNNTRENILRVYTGLVKRYRAIFDRFNPDLFLPANALGSISVHIFEQICRERNLPYITPTTARIKNIFAFANDHQLRFPQVDETYNDLITGKQGLDLREAEKLYEELMSELKDSQFFDRNLPCHNVIYLERPWQKLKYFMGALKSLGGVLINWFKLAKVNKSDNIRRQPYKLSILWDNLMVDLQHQIQNYKLLDPKFGQKLEPGQKYLYYPLHTSPEYSTSFQGVMWMNQEFIIESLAKSIPADWVIYVKEHPGTIPDRVRPADYYKKLKRFPNVLLAPVGTDSHEIISNAQMVAVVTGTSGWEAIQRGVPVITFSDNFYTVTGLARRCSNIETLSRDIHLEMKAARAISPQERKKRIVGLLASIIKHGFSVSHPNQFCCERGTIEEYELCGKEEADALIREGLIPALKKEKGLQNVG